MAPAGGKGLPAPPPLLRMVECLALRRPGAHGLSPPIAARAGGQKARPADSILGQCLWHPLDLPSASFGPCDVVTRHWSFPHIFRYLRYPRLYVLEHPLLPPVLSLEPRQDVGVYGPFGYQVVDHDAFLLPLTVEPPVRLLVVFEVPGQAEPHDDVASSLQVEPVPRARRVAKHHPYLPSVPVRLVLFVPQLSRPKLGEGPRQPLLLADEVIEHEDGLPFVLLDDLPQGVDLGPVEFGIPAGIVVGRPAGQLDQLAQHDRGVRGGYGLAVQFQEAVPFHLAVGFPRSLVELYRHRVLHLLRQGQVILAFHRDADVLNRRLDLLFGGRPKLVLAESLVAADEVPVPVGGQRLA